ncbi:hypothetical protein FRC00_002680, partial [Tulasnella sp. 408]
MTNVHEDSGSNQDFTKQSTTKFIDFPGFKIQTLLNTYGSPWAPQDHLNSLEMVEAAETGSLLKG